MPKRKKESYLERYERLRSEMPKTVVRVEQVTEGGISKTIHVYDDGTRKVVGEKVGNIRI